MPERETLERAKEDAREANLHPRRPENLYGRMHHVREGNMEQAPRNRQSPLDFPKRDGLAETGDAEGPRLSSQKSRTRHSNR
jgi:hypothetical protein